MKNHESLRSKLWQLDGCSYKAYRDIEGSYQFPEFTLIIDRVQGDPFATPSKLRIKVPQNIAGFPSQLYQSLSRKTALEDYLIRQFAHLAQEFSGHRGSGKSGLIAITPVGQEVLSRNAANVDYQGVEVRFLVGLPARGRRILGGKAAEMLLEDVEKIVNGALKYKALDGQALQKQVETVEDADWLRQKLAKEGLVAFIANGAILPRRSGIDEQPLGGKDNPIPWQTPPSLQVEFTLPNQGLITGTGIPQGITLIVGGGYHGKSTLLRALELGIYNHIPGDGRELVVTEGTAIKIRAEDGRGIVGVDISPFINHLPQNRSTTNFSTTNASGSTSQAANIIEALEMGTKLLLIDEDTAATNFMIRDHRMQQLIAKEKEPITPFIDKVEQLNQDLGVSTILVMGGSGDYFDVADTVIAMENFFPHNVTARAKEIAATNITQRLTEGGNSFGEITSRIVLPQSIDPSKGKKAVNIKVRDRDKLAFGKEDIDLSSVEQIVEAGQLKAIAAAIIYAKDDYLGRERTLAEVLDLVMADITFQGLDVMTDFIQGDLAMFRRFELAAAINRLRSLQVANNDLKMSSKSTTKSGRKTSLQ